LPLIERRYQLGNIEMPSPLPAFSLEVRETVEAELTRKLMDYLISSQLRPNDKLPSERQMAEALGVGRAALRTALKSLSLLGVVEQRAGLGTYLRNTSSDLLPRVIEWGLLLGENRIQDVLEARGNIEVILAGYAAERRTEQDLARMKLLINRMEAAGNNAAAYVESDIQFHLAIAESAKNDVLAGILRNLQSLLHAWASRVIVAAGETSSSLAMHVPILKAIEAGDPDAARAAMTAHMERAARRLREAISAAGKEPAGTSR
jgi:GntR family transcriptional repressor for pyruvate dehydrogenase complex